MQAGVRQSVSNTVVARTGGGVQAVNAAAAADCSRRGCESALRLNRAPLPVVGAVSSAGVSALLSVRCFSGVGGPSRNRTGECRTDGAVGSAAVSAGGDWSASDGSSRAAQHECISALLRLCFGDVLLLE